jgi:hypothetical protein
MFGTMQGLSLDFFDRRPVGQLLSRVTNDTEAVATFNENAVSQIMRGVFQILLIVVVMAVTNWRLTLAASPWCRPARRRCGRDARGGSCVRAVAGAARRPVGLPGGGDLRAPRADLHRRQDWAVQQQEEQAGIVFETASRATFTGLLQFPPRWR